MANIFSKQLNYDNPDDNPNRAPMPKLGPTILPKRPPAPKLTDEELIQRKIEEDEIVSSILAKINSKFKPMGKQVPVGDYYKQTLPAVEKASVKTKQPFDFIYPRPEILPDSPIFPIGKDGPSKVDKKPEIIPDTARNTKRKFRLPR